MPETRDRARSYLVTVGSYPEDGLDAHLAVTAWYDRSRMWAHSTAIWMLAFGLAGPGKPVIRYNAHRCPACQEMRVYQRVYRKGQVGADVLEIAYHPPRTEGPK